MLSEQRLKIDLGFALHPRFDMDRIKSKEVRNLLSSYFELGEWTFDLAVVVSALLIH